ncbi:MAG TPA: glutamate--tRNA ligase, partial [Oceanipulchritudo sp.]|nr:glutamate--tRNA ligase [Oceanipulchritudo sp.]
ALIEEYEQRHFLPAAVRNAITLLGWNPGDNREVMDIGEIIAAFDIRNIQKGAARFDEDKMAYINFQYLKALPVETYAWFARPVLTAKGLISGDYSEDQLQRVLAICQDKITSLEALPDFCGYFFTDDYPVDEKTQAKLLKKGDPAELAGPVKAALEAIAPADWTAASLEAAFNDLAQAHGEEKPFRWWPLTRFAVSGLPGGPDFIPMLEVLGRDTVLRRLGRMA